MNADAHIPHYIDLIGSMIPSQIAVPSTVSRPADLALVACHRMLRKQINPVEICELAGTFDDSIMGALAAHVAGELLNEPLWVEKSRKRFLQLIAQQQISGAFLAPDARMNPETRWYEELVTLHAVAGYAVQARDAEFDSAVAWAAEYHLRETQPDHATAQPWGLLAFVRYTPPLADQVLHAVRMQYPAEITGVPLLLLADVLYGLRVVNGNTDNEP